MTLKITKSKKRKTILPPPSIIVWYLILRQFFAVMLTVSIIIPCIRIMYTHICGKLSAGND